MIGKNERITEIISKAKNGDKQSRDRLINHYSYIVERIAKNYDYMEYEDLVQFGMIKLITLIDHQLLIGNGSLFSPRLIKYIQKYFDVTLRNQVKLSQIKYENDFSFGDIDFTEKSFEIELEDLINSKNISKKDKLCAIKYFVQKLSLTEIGDIYGCSKQSVSVHINKVTQKIKSEYTK